MHGKIFCLCFVYTVNGFLENAHLSACQGLSASVKQVQKRISIRLELAGYFVDAALSTDFPTTHYLLTDLNLLILT